MLYHRHARPRTRAAHLAIPPQQLVSAGAPGDVVLLSTLRDEPWLRIGADGALAFLLRADGRWTAVTALTIVVADIAATGARLAARLGSAPEALDPAEMVEAGLAQRFTIGDCALTLLEPADDTAAAHFLAEYGPGVYRVGEDA